MYKPPLFISWTLLLVFIAALHIVALEFFLYWIYPWFDIMMHLLAGLFVSLCALWFFFESGYIHINKNIRNVIFVVGVSITFVGVGWEIFEVLAGVPIEKDFVLDTAIDLLMDVLGAFIAVCIFTKMYITKHIYEGDSE